jgi:predicted glycoside hydrolase/deacetylase ChbG (UPF0249 family)
MSLLIINADDLGYSSERDAGIFNAFECNAITAASLIVNGPSAITAAVKAKEVGLYLSLHLNLTEGSSLTGPSVITDEKNQFYYKSSFFNLINGDIKKYANVIKQEVFAQLDRFKKLTGTYPSHVDGHQHVHVFPQMADVLAPIFKMRGVRSVRIPDEDVSNYDWLKPSKKTKYANCFPTCLRARLVYRSYDIRAPECFMGLGLMGKDMNHERFFESLSGVFGSIEWMVHPGYKRKKSRSDFNDLFDCSDEREHELRELKGLKHGLTLSDWSCYDSQIASD